MYTWPSLRRIPSPPSFQHVRMTSEKSLAASLVRLLHKQIRFCARCTCEECQKKKDSATLLNEDEQRLLESILSSDTSGESSPPVANPPPAPDTKPAIKKVQKKIAAKIAANKAKEDVPPPIETATDTTTDTTTISTIEKAYRLQTINPSLCQARKVNDKDYIKGTDAHKVYAEIQCPRKKMVGSDFCKFCAANEEKWRTGGGKEKKWCHRVTEPIPDHLHIMGSAWFNQTYPDGLSGILAVSSTTSAPTPPPTDSVFDDTAPIQDVAWEAFTYHGIPMIRHMTDGRVYKADMTKEGAERIVLSQFQGRWENGDLNIYATLDEDEEAVDTV